MKKYKYPFYLMRHPFDGFYEMRYKNGASLGVSFVILIAFILQSIIKYTYTGKQFKFYDITEINIISTAIYTVGALLVVCASNWAFSVLIEGKATFREIWILFLYSLVPYIIANYIYIILSNVVTESEGVFINVLVFLGGAMTLIMIINAFMAYHEFNFTTTLISWLLTLLGVAIILFLIILIISLFQQVASTISTIFYEAIFRFK